MPRISAELLMYRIYDGKLQVLLAHPGGPYFKNKDEGAWSIPKGEVEPGEDLLETAKREFEEETGVTPTGPVHRFDGGKAKGRKNRSRLGVRGGLRSERNRQQHLHDGMATKVRATDGIS